ncbi:amino acid racemase [Mesorhizobium sp. CAU 1741]|uniref:aspartate/glutamate racemase family protein n=1 Tax=Mesorhizobium sp. CAU 1741 TaxID=3140366 RepID=UPI00325AA7E8
MSLRKIGILGGMGPEATVLFMQKTLAAVPARDDVDHIPLLVDQNPQVPSRIRHLIEKRGESPAPVLAAMARGLEVAGAEALAMPCNTAHHYAPDIRSAVAIPFIDMVALAADRALEQAGAGGRVGILASPATRLVGLFDQVLAARGLEAVYPARDEDALAIIRRIKAGDLGAETRAALRALSSGLLERDAEVQMIACTEFSLIPDAVDPRARCFDTLDLLVDAVVGFSRSTPDDRS